MENLLEFLTVKYSITCMALSKKVEIIIKIFPYVDRET